LLGGGKDAGPVSRRPLTEIELRLVGRITGLFLLELKHAWEGVLPLKLSVDRVESNPQLVQIVPPNEVVVLISFELTLGELRGMINLCIPFNAIERVSSRITANSWVTYGKTSATTETRAAISERLDQAEVELIVTLAETKITTSDLIGLRVGDIITTDKDIHLPLDVAVQGEPKYHASVGAYKGSKAIRIEATPAAGAASTK
jgi:flagellar motor switch protein FliM